MALSDMVIYNEEIQTSVIETVDQMVDKFNAASNGTITLASVSNMGDYKREAFWKSIHSAQRRRNAHAGTNPSVTATDLTQDEHVAVKVAGAFGPVLFQPQQLLWLQKSPEEAIEVISMNVAESILKDQLNTAILAGVAAIENNAALVNDVSASKQADQVAVNGAMAKFGDMSNSIAAHVMTGAQYHNFVGQNLANVERLFEIQGVLIAYILGRAVVVTDAPALFEAGTPDKQKVLSLVPGALMVEDNQDFFSNIETTNGTENISRTFQAEYTFECGVMGYKWDIANGGPSPNDTAIGTGTNWDKVATSDKHTAGVLTIGQA